MIGREQPQAVERGLVVEDRREQNAVALSFRYGRRVVDAAHHAQASAATSVVAGDLRRLPLLPRL
jgi:hypothetical protein